MKLDIKNFRSIRDQSVELAPITVLYGPNGSGKSSLLYALLVMKNVILNSNRTTSNFFDLGFVNLGSFEAVVHDHHPDREISLKAEFGNPDQNTLTWSVQFGKHEGRFLLKYDIKGAPLEFELPVSFPYRVDLNIQRGMNLDGQSANVTWNGINARLENAETPSSSSEFARRFVSILNSPVELLRNIGAVPLQRGFLQADYSPLPVSPLLVTENDIASLLADDGYLVSRVSRYLDRLMGRDFRVKVTLGTSIFSLFVTERSTGVGTEIVNDGFGVNQVAWLLARILYGRTTWICVEEPETHLHPSAIRELAKTFVELMRNEDKRFILTTHSEALVLALLTEVSRKNLKPDEVAFYLTSKEGKETKFERQEVNELGQIEGGLTSFMEGELEEIAAFFGRTV